MKRRQKVTVRSAVNRIGPRLIASSGGKPEVDPRVRREFMDPRKRYVYVKTYGGLWFKHVRIGKSYFRHEDGIRRVKLSDVTWKPAKPSDPYATGRLRKEKVSAKRRERFLKALQRTQRKRARGSRVSRDPAARLLQGWAVWTQGDRYEKAHFIEAFHDKGKAQDRIKRLQKSQKRSGMRPYSYTLKRVRLPKRRFFEYRRLR